MATGDTDTDPVTGEPEIELADGSMVTDWNLLKGDPNRQMLPLGVGVVVPHFATVVPDDGWLPVSGGTFNDVDYPELAGAIAAGNTVGADLGNGTFRLLNLNGALTDGRGRVFEGLGTQTPGELQNDATAVNGLRVNRTYVQSDWNAQQNTDVSKGSNSNPGRVIDGQVLSSSQTQTRAPAVSVLWMVRAKPWTHAGDVTINQGATADIDDQSASGYLDVGAVREQWGTRTINSLGTITYPAPFKAGTVPNITGTNIDSGGLIRSLVANGNPGVTSASVFSVESDGTTATGTFMWRAIGLKP